jgi:hypothetical protein
MVFSFTETEGKSSVLDRVGMVACLWNLQAMRIWNSGLTSGGVRCHYSTSSNFSDGCGCHDRYMCGGKTGGQGYALEYIDPMTVKGEGTRSQSERGWLWHGKGILEATGSKFLEGCT